MKLTQEQLRQIIREEITKLNEGYEAKILKLLRGRGIRGSFRDGILYVPKKDVQKAQGEIMRDRDILQAPDVVGV